MTRTIIVGAGHAGGTAAATLRSHGYDGDILVIGEEPMLPYQRPPLSKAFLKGAAGIDDLLLRPLDFYLNNAIDIRLEEAVISIDRDAKTVSLAGGERLAYDTLILATGARPRPLAVPGAELAGILPLRSRADSEALKTHLQPGRRIAIVGGGYVGLEVAASARALGAEAVVIERESRCLARVASEPLSRFFEGYHRGKGVAFVLDAAVAGYEGRDGRGTAVRLADGQLIACDAVVVGIGAIPNDELARGAGLVCSNGIEVDENARTSDAAIYAIGDVTFRPVPLYRRQLRLESVPSALEQAKQAAAHICGRPAPAPETPWFWSDQYDVKLQIAGLSLDCDRLLVRGDPASGRFAVFHLRGDRIRAVEAVNAPAEFMMGRTLIGSRQPVLLDRLANPEVSMKTVIADLTREEKTNA